MADIALYEDDPEDTIDSDTSIGLEDYDSDPCDPDAGLSMLQRLEKYCHDDNMYTRQIVTRSLLETIRTIENEQQTEILLDSIITLADDTEAMVRSELMEQLPHVAIFCLENAQIFGDPLPTHLLPIVVKYITDTNNQVRKTSQAALLVLLEQEMIKRDDVVEQVCPVILDLSHPESLEDFRIEAVALMSKLAPLIGKEASEHIFLERFSEMCTDPLFSVRKVCATNFGDLSQVVGQENTEKILLPKFYYLCEDGVWGVRKSCAECFMQISCVCSIQVRRTELAQLFVNLICDQSRWVRMAAFQALGGFISTFADSSKTGLYFNDEGMLMVGDPDNFKNPSNENNDNVLSSDTTSCDTSSSESRDNEANSESPASLEEPVTSSDTFSDATSDDSSADTKLMAMEVGSEVESTTDAIQQLHIDRSVEEQRADSVLGNSKVSTLDSDSMECHSETNESEVVNSASISGASSDSERLSSSNSSNLNETCVNSLTSTQSNSQGDTAEASSRNKVHIHMDNNASTTAFNTFQFWRMPLPEIDVDVDIVNGKAANIHVKAKVKDEESSTALVSQFDVKVTGEDTTSNIETSSESTTEAMEVDSVFDDAASSQDSVTKIHTASLNTVCETVEEVANFGSTHVLGHHVNESTITIKDGIVQFDASGSPGKTETSRQSSTTEEVATQDMIPQALLDHYVSMTDPSRAQTVDSEIAKHCAYSLPAVAYTLGRRYWPCLRDLYEDLAGDMQWKVRRTLAFSIHELAVIVGEEITNKDLVPVFNGFLKDLDEVRIGVLKHLGDFLKLLKPDVRREYLTKIYEFLNTDNARNWRFREELAQQLRNLLELYSADDITQHLVPVAFMLAEDSVAAVRSCAFSVLSAIVGRLITCEDSKNVSTLVHDMTERFAQSPRWANRQMYIEVCKDILEDKNVPQEMFATDFLPVMLSLANDPIPNVRITLSRTLSRFVLNSDYFTSGQNPNHADLLETLQKLKSDSDRDVRHFLLPMTDNTEVSSDTIPV